MCRVFSEGQLLTVAKTSLLWGQGPSMTQDTGVSAYQRAVFCHPVEVVHLNETAQLGGI